MRNSQVSEYPVCELLVYYLNPTKYSSSNIVFGAALMNSFFGEFTYTGGDQNTIQLNLGKATVPGTYIGSQSGTVNPDAPPLPDPTPVPDPPAPTPDPTPTIVNGTSSTGNAETINILLLSGEAIIMMCLLACMIYLCVNKTTCCKRRAQVGDFGINSGTMVSDQEAEPFTPQY